MALKSKSYRLPLRGPQLTPISRSTVKLSQSRSQALFGKPGVQGANSPPAHTLQAGSIFSSSQAKIPILSGQSSHPSTTVQQTLSRRLSMPGIAQNEHMLPRIRSRAASDPGLLLQAGRGVRDRTATRPAERSAVRRCCHLSQVGSVLGRPKANNQDAHFYVSSFAPGAEMSVIGVCDGHGESGHHVSSLVSKRLPLAIRETFIHFIGRTMELWPTVLIESFKKVSNDLSRQSFDITYSGSTCVTVVLANSLMICANVGDSRAVLAKRNGTSFTAVNLSRDQKPDVEEEKQRIIDFGGRVEPVRIDGEDIGPLRVWLKNEDAPGLAMTRALGDLLGSRIGVISTPEITTTPVCPEDAFVILASDGIWEFITSQEAVDIVGEYVKEGRLDEGCQVIVAEATKRWRKEEDCVDDITVLIAELGNCA